MGATLFRVYIVVNAVISYTNRVHYKGSTLHVYLFALQPPCGTVQLHDTDIDSLLSPAVVLEGAAPAEQAERVALFLERGKMGAMRGREEGVREGGRKGDVGRRVGERSMEGG